MCLSASQEQILMFMSTAEHFHEVLLQILIWMGFHWAVPTQSGENPPENYAKVKFCTETGGI